MEHQDELKALLARSAALDARVQKLENYWTVTVIVAGVLGLGGAWLGTTLSEQKKAVEILRQQISEATEALSKAKGVALSEISGAEKRSLASVSVASDQAKEAIATFALQKKSETMASTESVVASERTEWQAADRVQRRWITRLFEHASPGMSELAMGTTPNPETFILRVRSDIPEAKKALAER